MEEERRLRSDTDESKELGGSSAAVGAAGSMMRHVERHESVASAHSNRSRLDSTTGGSDEDDDTVSLGEGKRSDNPSGGLGSSTSLDKYTIIRREKRLAMNRESARNRRQRKKQLIQTLDEQVGELRKSNQLLQSTNDSLTTRIRVLENELASARSTISQLAAATTTGTTSTASTHETRSSAGSFPSQHFSSNQSQFLQQGQVFHPIYPSTLSNPSSMNVAPASMEGTDGSSIPHPFDPMRSFGRTGEIPMGMVSQSDRSAAPGASVASALQQSSSMSVEASDNLSRLMQMDHHFNLPGVPTAMKGSGSTAAAAAANPSWGMPSSVASAAPFAFPTLEDSLRGVSTNWEMTERHDTSRGGMIPHLSNRNTQPSISDSGTFVNPYRFDALSPSSEKFRVFDAVVPPHELRGNPSEAGLYRPQLEDLLRQRNTEELLRHQNKEELHRHQQQQQLQQQLQLMQQQHFQLQQMQQPPKSHNPPDRDHPPTGS